MVKLRYFNHSGDYQRIDDFLIRHHQPGNTDGNWLEPAWEYMHAHGQLDRTSLGRIGTWEENGEIVAVAHYESKPGEAFFQFHPGYHHLRREMLDHAEADLAGISRKDGRKFLCAYVNDDDAEFQALVQARGYSRNPEEDRPMARFEIPDPFPPITLPMGYRLVSLADDPDWVKVNRVLWRGFDHEGEPENTPEEIEGRRRMFETPRVRLDLKVAVEAPDGNFAAFCGMFHEPTGRYGYVEPVVTDPDHRRRGLGKAAVLEGIRRCGALGATAAYVGSNEEFYRAVGFKCIFTSECWLKYL